MKLTLQDVILIFAGYCLGEYVLATITVFGIAVPWALIGLGICVLLVFIRWCWKLFKVVFKELIKESIKEL